MGTKQITISRGVLILLGWTFFSTPLFTQNKRIGDWTTYLSHRIAIESVQQGPMVYAITEGGMVAYNRETEESQAFSTIQGLSGINPSTIHYAPETDQVFIGYNDGQVDFFQSPSNFGYLTDIERNTFFTQKAIRDFANTEDQLFIATDFGMVIYNLDNQLPETDITQFADNPTRLSVLNVAIFQNKVWVLLENGGLYSAPIDFPNLKDPAIWQVENGSVNLGANEKIAQIAVNSTRLYARTNETVHYFDGQSWNIYPAFPRTVFGLFVSDDAVIGTRINVVEVAVGDSIAYSAFFEKGVTHVSLTSASAFVVSSFGDGVLNFDSWQITDLTPTGPRTNDATRVAAAYGEVYVAPKGYDQAFTPDNNRLGVFYYHPESGWSSLDEANGILDPSVSTSFARVLYDEESRRVYAASWGSGLVEFQNGELQAFYNCENAAISVNSPPCDLNGTTNSRVSGLDLDPNGNLWITLDFAQVPLMKLGTDGQFIPMNANRFPSNDHLTDLLIDELGTIWMINEDQGILLYSENSTPDNTTDDWSLSLRSGVNQGNLPSNTVTSLAMDQDGFVWVGTTQGVTVYYNLFELAERRIVDASPPVFERRPLLKDAVINAIAVDGGNRKWMATNDGVFLVSEEGDDVIQHFTEENSPLLSNTVNDIAIDALSGEVYFATSRGLISYRGDATQGTSECEDLFVYPNPVFTDFDGLITIKGTAQGSRVRITDISGKLVKEVISEGGTAVWDGLDVYGNKVSSGVYLALAADRNGENACVGKFTVIRR
ncbi:MAG: two-component regulator propeller domain-containing protein [Bacteroidota bacterium]